MISDSPLARANIGGVGYLNTKPLIYGIESLIRLGHPSVLAGELHSGSLDGALVPVFEALAHPVGYFAVDGIGIVAHGEVYSVAIAHSGPVEKVRQVFLDPASLTSVNLTKVIIAEFLQQPVEYQNWDGITPPSEDQALLVIGDQAIRFREKHPKFAYLDLGQVWMEHTGLPFVFALWILRENCPGRTEVADALRAAAASGLKHIEEIRSSQPDFPPEFVARYLGGFIRYEVSDAEKQAIREYGRLLAKHHLIENVPPETLWI